MRTRQSITLRTKLTLWTVGVLAIIIIGFSVVVLGVVEATALNNIDADLRLTATNVIRQIRIVPVGDFGSLKTRIMFRNEDIFQAPGISIQVWQSYDHGESIEPVLAKASSDLSNFRQALNDLTLQSAAEQFHHVTINDIPGRVTTRPFFELDGRQVGVVQVAVSTQVVQQVTNALVIVVLAACAIAISVALAMGFWLSRRILKPIQDLTETAATIAETNDLSTRLSWDGPMDELGRLTRVFNRMMARLEYLFGVQQRFVADVSHELRTPLTSIQGNIEIIERYGVDDESIEALHEETQRMSRLVNDILLLARADYGALEMDLYPLEIDTLLLRAYEQLPHLLNNRQLHVGLGAIETLVVKGNADRLKQAVTNLLVNAIQYTPDGGHITLSVHQEHNQAVVTVKDTGVGLTPQQQKDIFNRFYRVDDARTHTGKGFGLGLSIVKWIIDTHHGLIEVESAPNQGSIFKVYLPLVPQPEKSKLG